jgi:hypothetical protein
MPSLDRDAREWECTNCGYVYDPDVGDPVPLASAVPDLIFS